MRARADKEKRGGRAAGQVLIVPTAPVENERANERNGKSFGREAGVSHDLRRLLLPSVRNVDTARRYASTSADYVQGEKWRKIDTERVYEEWKKRNKSDRSTPPPPVTCFYVHAAKHPYRRVSQTTVRWLLFSFFFSLGSLYVFVDARGDEHDEINHVRKPRGLFSM